MPFLSCVSRAMRLDQALKVLTNGIHIAKDDANVAPIFLNLTAFLQRSLRILRQLTKVI